MLVKRGRILGKLKSPYKGLVRKPGIEYDKDDPNLMEPEVKKHEDKIEKTPSKPQEKPMDINQKHLEKRKPLLLKKSKILKRADSNRNALPPPPAGIKPL